MSSNQLSRSLQVVVTNVEKEKQEHYTTMLHELGHRVVATFPTKAELVAGLRRLPDVPDIIVTDICDPADLRDAYRVLTGRNVHVPVLIISSQLDQVIKCDELDFVFGICGESVDRQNLQVMLLVALHRFEHEKKLQTETQLAIEALTSAEDIQHACAILFDRHQRSSMLAARRLLQKIASSYRRPMKEQAERIIKADKEMHPQKQRAKKKNTKRSR